MVVLPVTSSVVKPVTVSPVASPNTALPITFRLCDTPATVPFVVIVEPESSVLLPSVTLSWYVCVPLVVTAPPLIAVVSVPAASVVTLPALMVLVNVVVPALLSAITPSACVFPALPVNVILPVPAFSVRLLAKIASLSTVLLNTMLPTPELVPIITLSFRVTPVAKPILVFVVLMSPASSLRPAPFWEKPFVALMSPAAAVVNKPELVTVTEPVAPTPAFTVRFVPIKPRLPPSVVVPLKVVVPVPACWVKLAAVTAELAVKSLTEVILIAPNADEAPTSPVIEISPVPAMSDKPRAVPSLLIVLEKLMFPAPPPVERI